MVSRGTELTVILDILCINALRPVTVCLLKLLEMRFEGVLHKYSAFK